MQIIRGILLLKDGVASWVDQFGNSAADPALTIAVSTKIVLDIRQPLERSASTSVDAVLPAYPIEQLASTGLYFAMDSDYDQETIPKLIRTSDISVSTTDDGMTQVDFEVPNTDIEALHTALNNGASVSFKCELGGVDDSGATVFVIQFSMGLRNRIYIPGDSPDTPDPEDPAWLPAIRAIIAAEVAAAALPGTPGTPSYTYVAYASDADGTDFSLTPSGELEYRAEFVSSTLISEPDLDDFITANAVFVRYIVPGAAGASSKLYVAYATAVDGSGFSLTPGADKPYRAEFISSNLALTPVLADFTAAGATWVKYLGTDGIDGFGVTPQGAWSADNSPYDLHDMVTTAYGWFLSLIDNNNAAPPVPPATSDSWQLIVANGRNGYNVIRAYNTVPDADDTGWHTTQMADDLYYRDSMDGGVTWTAAVALSQAAVLPIARFAATYVEADADWWAPVAEPGVEFATARCAYFRFKLAGGSFSPESLIIQLEGDPTPEEVTAAENLLLSADLSIQYSATSAEDGDWHGALAAGDRCVRLYNAAGTVRVVWNLGGTAGVDIAAFEVAVGAGIAWHDIPQVADHYMKISVDGGATWGGVFRINAESAYDEWLAAGNIGTREDFLDSLKGEPGVPGAPGSGIHIDASGTLAERDNYDSTPLGFVYLASDGDGSGGPALFQRSSATQGSWSSAVPVTVGPKGADGKDGKDGAPGASAPIIPDFEFTSAEVIADVDYGNHLIIDGTAPIAQVELYDAAGNGIVIERGDAAENGRCMIVTRWSAGETIIYFGELDVSRGGRVRFAHSSAVYTGRTVTTDIIPVASAVADTDDDDGDADTAYKVIIQGYVVGVSTYSDAGAILADRYETKITYDPATAESTIWLSQGEYDTIASLPSGKDVLVVDYARDLTAPRYMITQVVNTAAPAADKYPSEAAVVDYAAGLAIKSVTALPATPIAGQMIRLTTADDTAKAAPGVYMHDGVGWTCVSYESAYALGNLGATPSLTLIPGAAYTATVDAEITTFTVAFTRPGLVSITLTNASTLAIAQPSMSGRTSKLLADGAWDGAATALSKALIEDDGTYLIVSAGGLV